MKFKLFKKFFLTTTLVILLSLTVITVLLCFFVSNYLTREKQTQLKENCHAVAEAVAELDHVQLPGEGSEALFRAMSRVTDADLFITDTNGKVLMCSCDDWQVDGICVHNQTSVPAEIMQKVLGADYSETGNLDGHYPQAQFTHAAPLCDQNGVVLGGVFSSLSPQSIRLFYNTILKLFFISALVPIIIMFFAEYFISYRFVRPLHLMAEAARSMAKGDFSKRIPVTGDDEIGELAVAFNQMTNSLVQIEGTRRRFVANVSHELKTPMTTIGGFIDGIIDGTIPPEKQPYYLSIVSTEIKRLSRLVQSMLSLSKLESGEQQINRSDFDICDMVFKIVVSQEQRIAEREIGIEGLDQMPPTVVNADYDLIYQVIYNLVDNAVKFTDTGGTITFSVVSFENAVEFKIRNTGEGIDQKDLPFVFERFYKTDKSRSAVKDSTGLGLYLANTIIAIHGGKISVQSEVRRFTEFTFILPQKQ